MRATSRLATRHSMLSILHTALCHIPEPHEAPGRGPSCLKPGGWIAVFDGDYASATVALAEHDPLQACSRAVTEHNVMDRWIVRRLPEMVKTAGFDIQRFRSHGYAEVVDPAYMLGHAERGAEVLQRKALSAMPLPMRSKLRRGAAPQMAHSLATSPTRAWSRASPKELCSCPCRT